MTTRDPLFPETDSLDDWFPRGAHSTPAAPGAGQRLGVVVGGSLSRGLDIKLDPQATIELLEII